MAIGVAVLCKTCGMRKAPIGRAPPLALANSLCDHECPGYYDEPSPGFLWPGESDCARCGGSRLVTIFNYDGNGSDADDQPCPECGEESPPARGGD